MGKKSNSKKSLIKTVTQHILILFDDKSQLQLGHFLSKYCKWPLPLSDMHCAIEKADILLLPTLAYDKSTIVGIFDILQNLI